MTEKICSWCKEFFTPDPKAHVQKYCSKECYNKAHNKQKTGRRRISKYGNHLDMTLKEAKDKGMTFAQLQMQKTLDMVKNNEC